MSAIIKFHNVSKHFGSLKVIDEVDLEVRRGEVVVLVGPSGSGKSTLLRCINGLEMISGGDLIVDQLSVKGGNKVLREIRQEAGMVFQQFNLFPQMTALENIAFGQRQVRHVGRQEAKRHARELLDKVGLADKEAHYPHELSGGQQQRVAIARSLAIKPKVMLFDEPTSALDPELKQEVLNVMRTLADEHMTMVVVTHEMSFAKQVGTRLIFMEHGKIAVDGKPAEVIDSPPNDRMRDFLRHV
ncbi:glutamine ABC transporter ATP-binding protein GlnQ [Halomonas sp. Y3]|uniref:glutamine ABC transporter ATP-binding protein GlnQ n=1 Tax=Halomonas sp. Y3 TaxID=2956797 RepID=UPI0020A032E2|nr:glutamine ABC transporter ATP-binding protein GlnQ [Halomonas sp. Y3]